ncbi:cell division protein FtsQ/DivIB [Nesterenkonia suensis]
MSPRRPRAPYASERREESPAEDLAPQERPGGEAPGPLLADAAPSSVGEGRVVALSAERPRRARITAAEAFDDGDGPEEGASGSPGGPREAEEEPAEPVDVDLLPFPEPEVVGARRRRRRRIGWTAGALGLLVAVVAVLYYSPLLTIEQVQVEGNELLTETRAQELLQPLYGRPLPQVGNAQVQELLAEEPVVEDVVVQGELPNTLSVDIVEHPPVAEVRDGDGLLFYNEHGDVIRRYDDAGAEHAQGYATPQISNEAALQDEAVFGTIVSVLGQLPAAARETMDSATAESIDSVRLILDDGRTVVWGGEELGEQKATVLEAILASEAEDFTAADVIDISTPDTPVIR